MDTLNDEKKTNSQLAESIVGTVRNPLLVLDIDLLVISANQAFYNTFMVSKNATIGKHLYNLGNGQWEIESLRTLLEDILSFQHEVYDYEVTHNFPTIGRKIMIINARRIIDNQAKGDLILLSIEDVTERREKELKLQKISDELYLEKEKARNTLLSIGDGLIVTDNFGRIVELNDISVQLTGYSQEEAIGKPFDEVFKIYSEKTMLKRENPVEKVIKTGLPTSIEKDTILISKNDKQYFIEDSVAPIKNKAGKMSGVICIYRDITLLKNKIIENEYISRHDHLTDLYNRRTYAEELIRLDSSEHYPLGIMMMDVDGLKIFNDAFGHSVGDIVLKKTSEVLMNVFKQQLVFRTGGDEFAAIIPNCSEEKLISLREEINISLSKFLIKNIYVSLAIGFYIKKDIDENIEDILKFAENNMYKVKTYKGKSHRNHAIKAIFNTLTSKYKLERIHSTRVSQICVSIGEELGLDLEDLKELRMAGMYHDIGKISIPDAILKKSGKLTEKEFDVIKTHTEIGYQILRSADESSDLAKYALSHHERIDGKGYPNGIPGKDIPLFSRIISVADAYEAMTSDRPYRKAMNKTSAIEELISHSGTQFDVEITNMFIDKVLSNASN